MADFTRDEVIQVIEGGRKCSGADLRDIDLHTANLWGASLGGADLTGANLIRAILRGADLRKAVLSGAKYNANTKWPEGFDPEATQA